MDPAAPSAIPLLSAPVLARSDLPDLANFRDTNGHAVSFFFSLQSIPDKSHHTEVILVRDLVREELHQIDTRKAPGLAEDMEAVLMQAEEVRENPRYWRISYACHRQGYWRKFELPAPKPIRQLHVGGRFLLAPMFWALNFCTPYGVLIFERGRARIFVVRGFQIQEFNGRLPKENITLHVRASRSDSEKHREHHLEGHVRAYCKELAEKVRVFLANEKLHEMVFGCREDLWGEAKPEFADFEKGVLIGRFVPSGYDARCGRSRGNVPDLRREPAQERRGIAREDRGRAGSWGGGSKRRYGTSDRRACPKTDAGQTRGRSRG